MWWLQSVGDFSERGMQSYGHSFPVSLFTNFLISALYSDSNKAKATPHTHNEKRDASPKQEALPWLSAQNSALSLL